MREQSFTGQTILSVYQYARDIKHQRQQHILNSTQLN